MKKTTILCFSVIVLIILCGICPGCQKKASPEPAPATAEEASPAATTAPAPEPAPAEKPVIKYDLRTSVSPGGSGTIRPDRGTYDTGTELKLTATPSSGYAFDRWSGDVTGDSETITVTMNGDTNATAHFIKRQYALSTSVTPEGSGLVSPDKGFCDAGSKLTLTATPLFGHTFDHWSGDATGTRNPVTITMDSDKNVTAVFIKAFNLRTSISPTSGGSISLSPDGGVYNAGTAVTLTAAAADGYTFDSWGGDVTGRTITATVVMDADKSVTASFRNLLAEGILFEDNFDDNRNKWGDKADIKDGALHLKVSAMEGKTTTNFQHKWPFEAPNYPNFGYEVDMTAIEAEDSKGRGIIFLCDPAKDVERHWFLFVISGDGYYSLYYYQFTIEDQSNYRSVVGWTASNYINKGTSTNKLKVICRDSVIELYVNDHLLKTVHGEFPDNIGANGVGFFIQATGATTHLAFDNMKMWIVD